VGLNASLVGRAYPPSAPYEVGREKIREFAAAVGDTSAACVDLDAARELGHPDVVAPPTFPIVFTWAASAALINDPDLGMDFSRVVHGEQKFAYTRPVYAGDRLVTEVTIESIREVGGSSIITSRADVATEAGEPVVTARSTLFVRGDS
jgi:acyl dehydratase